MRTLDDYRAWLDSLRQKGNTTALLDSPQVRSGQVVLWVGSVRSIQHLKNRAPAADIRPISAASRTPQPYKASVVDLDVLEGVLTLAYAEKRDLEAARVSVEQVARLTAENRFLRSELERLLEAEKDASPRP